MVKIIGEACQTSKTGRRRGGDGPGITGRRPEAGGQQTKTPNPKAQNPKLPADAEAGAVGIEFLEPNARGLIEDLAHVVEGGGAGLAVGDFLLIVSKGFLENVETGVELGDFVGSGGELLGVERALEGAKGGAQDLELLPDQAVAAVAIVGGGLGAILDPSDLGADALLGIALGHRGAGGRHEGGRGVSPGDLGAQQHRGKDTEAG